MKKIQSALISVFDKTGIDKIARKLHKNNIHIISTGGTQKHIESLNIPVTSVESLTDYPSILGGRVKTLHPKIFGGILFRDDHSEDLEEIKKYNLPKIDLVIVDLYPFGETVKLDFMNIFNPLSNKTRYNTIIETPIKNPYSSIIIA